MSGVDQALAAVTDFGRALLGVFVGIFGVIERFLRQLLSQAGVPENFQAWVILIVAVLFIVAVLRLFGGFFRILLLVFLILLILHVLLPPGSY